MITYAQKTALRKRTLDTLAGLVPPSWRIDLAKALAGKCEAIADVWCVEDVQSAREDLNDAEAWQVLIAVQSNHDAEYGINWDVIQHHAESLYPES